MKFVLVKAPESATPRQKQINWTYLCELPVKVGRRSRQVRVGDYVIGEFGCELEIMEVVEVASRRNGLSGSDYTGAVKTCVPAPKKVLDAVAAHDKAWAAVSRAEQRACAAGEDLSNLILEAIS